MLFHVPFSSHALGCFGQSVSSSSIFDQETATLLRIRSTPQTGRQQPNLSPILSSSHHLALASSFPLLRLCFHLQSELTFEPALALRSGHPLLPLHTVFATLAPSFFLQLFPQHQTLPSDRLHLLPSSTVMSSCLTSVLSPQPHSVHYTPLHIFCQILL